MNKAKKYNFSLIELLASIAIFAILMVVVMNMFSGATNLLSNNASNTKMSAAAQTAFDYLEERIINCDPDTLTDNFSTSEEIQPLATTADALNFMTSVNISEGVDLKYRRYGEFFIGLESGYTHGGHIHSKDWALKIQFITEGEGYEEDFTTLLDNVTNFTVTAYDVDMNKTKTAPKYIKIDIEMLSEGDFEVWYADGHNKNSDFYKEKVFVYTRIITLP